MAAELRNKIFDFDKLVLYTDSPEQGKRARMQFGGRDGNPRITVFTGVTDAKNGIIQGPLEVNAYLAFISLLETVANSTTETKYKIDIKGQIYENNVRKDGTRVISELWFGRDEKGIVWIALTAEGQPKIKFEFMNGIYTDIYYNGVKLTDGDISSRIALKYVEILKAVFSTYTMEHSMQPRVTNTEAANTTPGRTPARQEAFEDIAF